MTSIPVQIFGQEELERQLRHDLPVGSHLISIGNPRRWWRKAEVDEALPSLFRQRFQKVLRLEFFDQLDVEALRPEQPKRIPQFRDVAAVKRFFDQTQATATGYVVHCWAGTSRSPAVALGLLYLIHGSEESAARELMRIRYVARPHAGIVKDWDKLLGSRLADVNDVIREARLEQIRATIQGRLEEL